VSTLSVAGGQQVRCAERVSCVLSVVVLRSLAATAPRSLSHSLTLTVLPVLQSSTAQSNEHNQGRGSTTSGEDGKEQRKDNTNKRNL
jgi:hypothetical protein